MADTGSVIVYIKYKDKVLDIAVSDASEKTVSWLKGRLFELTKVR